MMDTFKRVTAQMPDGIPSPQKWIQMYGDFVIANASSVSQIESALRSLTYIIPGRFRESEIASESLHSTIQLLSLYHTSLLTKIPSQTAKPTLHNRYTTHWRTTSPLYSRIALSLQTLQYTELLIEMLAKRRGGAKTRWRAIVFIESLKAICRLMLLRITSNRPLITPPLPERENIPTEPENNEEDEGESKSSESSWTMPRTSLTLPALPTPGTLNSYLLSNVLTADDIKAAPSLLGTLNTNPQLAAEVIYILRPVVYALLLQRWREQKQSWVPWLVGAGMEYGAYELAKKGREASGSVLTGLQKEEEKTRGGQMGWWALRGAFYESVTRPVLKTVTGKMKGKFGLDLIGGVVEDYEWLWSEYYFSTATL